MKKVRNHEDWRLEYMTLQMRDQEMMKKGREEDIWLLYEQIKEEAFATMNFTVNANTENFTLDK